MVASNGGRCGSACGPKRTKQFPFFHLFVWCSGVLWHATAVLNLSLSGFGAFSVSFFSFFSIQDGVSPTIDDGRSFDRLVRHLWSYVKPLLQVYLVKLSASRTRFCDPCRFLRDAGYELKVTLSMEYEVRSTSYFTMKYGTNTGHDAHDAHA